MSDLQSVRPIRRASLSNLKRAQLAGLMLLSCMSIAWAADKAAELSDDFLEYLGSLEGDDDNWTDFSADAALANPTVTAREATDAKIVAKDARTVAPAQDRNAASKARSSAASQSSAQSKATGKADK